MLKDVPILLQVCSKRKEKEKKPEKSVDPVRALILKKVLKSPNTM